MLMRLALRLYAGLLNLYPRWFRVEFADEMQAVFLEGAQEATARGALVHFCLREMRDAPQALTAAYWSGWLRKLRQAIELVHAAASPSDLPPPPPDGRRSWRQVGWELGLFLLAGLILIGITYLPLEGVPVGWQRDLGALGQVIVPATLPVFLVGLARGLPRWAYPAGGLLLSYGALAANQSGLLPFLAAMLLAAAILAVVAIVTDSQLSPLPAYVRRIGQSLALDWTRLSFGLYGAMPLAINVAFDDAHANNRTPFLAVSILLVIAGALIYCRSRQSAAQIGALLGGMSLAIWGAWLDKASFAGGVSTWIAAPRPGAGEIAWMLELWLLWVALLLAPALLSAAAHAVRPGRAT
jgi:hypothetical protein